MMELSTRRSTPGSSVAKSPLSVAVLAAALLVAACSSSSEGDGEGSVVFVSDSAATDGQDLRDDGVGPQDARDAGDEVRDEGGEEAVAADVADGGSDLPQICTPGERDCLDMGQSIRCADEGTYWEVPDACVLGQRCNEVTGACAPVVCLPNDTECIDEAAHHRCLPSGTGWLDPVGCDEDAACLVGSCIAEACLRRVLLLVDVSASMSAHWETLQGSITALIADNPSALYGLATFPQTTGMGCEVNGAPKVPMDQDQDQAIADWFDDHLPFGMTPLLWALQDVLLKAPQTFEGNPGALVVLSDGADTCAYPDVFDVPQREAAIVADLAAATTTLHDDYGVRTYVVGYNYQGNPAQLDAIAAHGGTTMTTYTPAGSEQELEDALQGVIVDFKLCL